VNDKRCVFRIVSDRRVGADVKGTGRKVKGADQSPRIVAVDDMLPQRWGVPVLEEQQAGHWAILRRGEIDGGGAIELKCCRRSPHIEAYRLSLQGRRAADLQHIVNNIYSLFEFNL
jgi:hypothetical protein